MGKTRKYYVVWQGLHPGVYNNWEDCKEQVEGQSGAKYKAFESREAAEEAFANGYESYIQKNPTPKMVFEKMMKEKTPVIGRPINNSLAVDAACSGNPGDMEYKQRNCSIPIYSDSRNAISWVKNKKCKTLLERLPENEPIFDLIARAEKWLQENTYTTPIYKWETSAWGEIPADFGRK